jgi:hypothetical protein
VGAQKNWLADLGYASLCSGAPFWCLASERAPGPGAELPQEGAGPVHAAMERDEHFGKSPFDRECVVELRGLELRANHAVAIERVSGP